MVAEMNEKWKVPTEVREFKFSAYPPWMQINQTLGYFGGTGDESFCEEKWASWKKRPLKTLSSIHLTICGDLTGEYAWKAVMIHRVLVERGFAHWQDAGCRFKTSYPTRAIRKTISNTIGTVKQVYYF